MRPYLILWATDYRQTGNLDHVDSDNCDSRIGTDPRPASLNPSKLARASLRPPNKSDEHLGVKRCKSGSQVCLSKVQLNTQFSNTSHRINRNFPVHPKGRTKMSNYSVVALSSRPYWFAFCAPVTVRIALGYET